MLVNLLFGLSTMVLCLLLQSLLFGLALRYYSRNDYLVNNPSFWSSLAVIKGVMLLLVIGNLFQVAIWASLFLLLGEFQTFEEAFYHSAVNFATLGYGDIVMSASHKLLGPLEAVNGVLMIGVSTAALMSAFQDSVQKTLHARKR
ncbi:MAG: two pore domain potassium channel family protein [Gammaproteobacteria bacterium]|nr:two pore domain potassium channel family protein [Gammaproteobacteria bacterium]